MSYVYIILYIQINTFYIYTQLYSINIYLNMQNYISTDSLVGYEYLGQSLYTFLLFINKNKIKNKFYKRILRYLKAFTFYQNRWKKKVLYMIIKCTGKQHLSSFLQWLIMEQTPNCNMNLVALAISLIFNHIVEISNQYSKMKLCTYFKIRKLDKK